MNRLPDRLPLRGAELLALAVLLGAQLAVWPGLEQPGRAARHALMLVLAGPLLALWAAGPARLGRAPRLLALGLAVPLASGAVGWLAAAPGERPSVLQDLLVLAGLGALALLAAALPECGRDLRGDRAAAAVAALAVAVVAAMGLAEAWLGWSSPVAARRPAATYVNRNVAAQALVVMLPLALSGALALRRAAWRWLAGAACAGGLMLLVVIRGRGAWIALLVAISATLVVLGLWARRRVRWRRVAAVGAGLAALAALAPWIPTRSGEPLPTVRRSVELMVHHYEGSTLEIREWLWRNTAVMVGDAPLLGFGPGRFRVVYPLYQDAAVDDQHFGLDRQPVHAHNELLHTAAELGLPAMLVLLGFAVGAGVRTVRELSRAERGTTIALLAGRFAALCGVCAHGMVSFSWASVGSGAFAWWLMGRGWAGRQPVLGWPERRPRAWLAAALIPAVAATAAGIALAAGLLGAQAALGEGLRLYRAGETDRAARWARRAAELGYHRHELGLAAALVWSTDPRAETSLAVIEPALAAHPHHLNLLLDAGSRRLKAGRPEPALDAFAHAAGIDPQLSRAWLGIAMSHLELGDRSAATRACARAIRDPDLPAAKRFCFGNHLIRPPPPSR